MVDALTISQLAQKAGVHVETVRYYERRGLDERHKELDATRMRLVRLIDICEDPTSEDCRALRITG
jgi:hypothetical protein